MDRARGGLLRRDDDAFQAARATLEETVPFSTLELVTEQKSRDGTVKALFRTADGHPVESVLMSYRDGRRSLCLSSQSGCPLTCNFCATGAMRFGRNLTESEILDQALHFRRREPVNHAVYMGMGEPFLNFDAVLASARRLPDLGITHRRTTISTVGWMPRSQPLRRRGRGADQARSVDPRRRPDGAIAADARERPVPACRGAGRVLPLWGLRRRRVFVEYVLLAGVNDSPADARLLAELLGRETYKVNLIPYNPTGRYDGSTRPVIAAFKTVLDRARVPATVRLTRGRDINSSGTASLRFPAVRKLSYGLKEGN